MAPFVERGSECSDNYIKEVEAAKTRLKGIATVLDKGLFESFQRRIESSLSEGYVKRLFAQVEISFGENGKALLAPIFFHSRKLPEGGFLLSVMSKLDTDLPEVNELLEGYGNDLSRRSNPLEEENGAFVCLAYKELMESEVHGFVDECVVMDPSKSSTYYYCEEGDVYLLSQKQYGRFIDPRLSYTLDHLAYIGRDEEEEFCANSK